MLITILPPAEGENLTSLLTGVSEGRWNRLTPEEDMLPGSAQVTDSRSTDGCGDDGGGSQEPYEETTFFVQS